MLCLWFKLLVDISIKTFLMLRQEKIGETGIENRCTVNP